MNISRLLFSITILLTYPIECFVCREVLHNIIWGKMEDQDLEQSRRNHVILTLFLVFGTYMMSLVTDCLGIVLEINVGLFLENDLQYYFFHKIFFKRTSNRNYKIMQLLVKLLHQCFDCIDVKNH